MCLVWPVFGAWDIYSWYDKIYLCVHWHHASDFRLTNLPICLLWWRKLILCLDVWVVYDQRMLLLSRTSLPNLVRLPHCDRLLKSRFSWDRLTKRWSILQSWKMNLILICQPFFGNSLGLVVFYNWGDRIVWLALLRNHILVDAVSFDADSWRSRLLFRHYSG